MPPWVRPICLGRALLILSVFLALAYAEEPKVRVRANEPPPRIDRWVALGDSYSAGPGAGKEFDNGGTGNSGHCMRRDQAYAPQLERDAGMPPSHSGREFKFLSCTGDTTEDLLDFTKSDNQINQIPEGADLATLSIGGNDVLFGPILKGCIYGSPGFECEPNKKRGTDILFSAEFHKRYNKVLTMVVLDRLKGGTDLSYTKLYQTGYIQFFNELTWQCEREKLHWWFKGTKMKRELRKEFNLLVHELNAVLRYWMDIRNIDWTYKTYPATGPQTYWTDADWVDVDWAYNGHRFCEEGVKEPDRKNPNIWFYHAPFVPFKRGETDDNATVSMDDMITMQPNRPGEPSFDFNDPAIAATAEEKIRTFHPTPDGFKVEKDAILRKLQERDLRPNLAKFEFQFLTIGDKTALGQHIGFNDETRYGFLPYLHAILSRPYNFKGNEVYHTFLGRKGRGYTGDIPHEIYPTAPTIKDLWDKVADSDQLFYRGVVVLIVAGANDLMNGRSLQDMTNDMLAMLNGIFYKNSDTVVLLATVPMFGDPGEDGHEMYPTQRKIIQWNAILAWISNLYMQRYNGSGNRVVIVHLSSTQKERIDQNGWIPNRDGYERIAWDFFRGLMDGVERGFFGSHFFHPGPHQSPSTYNLGSWKEDEVGKVVCHQKRSDDSPSPEEILRSLYRGAADQADFVNSRACNTTWNCKFSWDSQPVMNAKYPFSNGTYCVFAGGDNERHTTHHQVLIRREGPGAPFGEWCEQQVPAIIEKCIVNEGFWGGFWTDGGKVLVNISNNAYIEGAQSQIPATLALENWDSQFGTFADFMTAIKTGGPDTSPVHTGALNIILEQVDWGRPVYLRREMKWLFYPTTFGTASQCAASPAAEAPSPNTIRGLENGYMEDPCPVLTTDGDPAHPPPDGCNRPNFINKVVFPSGTFDVKVGEDECQYKNDGSGNPGSLWCRKGQEWQAKGECNAHRDMEGANLEGVVTCDTLSRGPEKPPSKQVMHRAVVVCQW